MLKSSQNNYVEIYKDYVKDGVLTVCRLVRLAIERDDRNLEESKSEDYPYYFDNDYANDAINFIEHLKEPKSGKPIKLALFQKFQIGLLFGWREKEYPERRRFQKGIFSLARKQGKTLLEAGVLLYQFMNEPGHFKQVATAANSRDQAMLLFRMVVNYCNGMARDSKAMRKLLNIKRNEIEFGENNRLFPLSADYGTLDGYDLSAFVVDEYGAAKDSRVYDVLETSQQMQSNPLKVVISTCTDEFNGPFYNEYKYIQKLLDPNDSTENERQLVLWYQQDSKEEVEDFKTETWIKSNPILEFGIDELGYSKEQKEIAVRLLAKLENDYREGVAKHRTYNLLTKAFNIWTRNEETTYIMMNDWEKSEINEDLSILDNRDVYIGIDLSRLNDFTAISFMCPDFDSNRWLLYSHTFVGFETETIEAKESAIKMPLREWASKGYCTITSDETGIIRQADVLEYIVDFTSKYHLNIRYIQYDPYAFNTSYEMYKNKFGKNRLISVSQNDATLSEPTKEFKRRILSEEIQHFANPFLDIAINNAILKENLTKDTVKVDKSKNRDKIDNIIASIIAFVEPSKIDMETSKNRNNEYYANFTF